MSGASMMVFVLMGNCLVGGDDAQMGGFGGAGIEMGDLGFVVDDDVNVLLDVCFTGRGYGGSDEQ